MLGVWCNGSLGFSKNSGVGSIPTAPANLNGVVHIAAECSGLLIRRVTTNVSSNLTDTTKLPEKSDEPFKNGLFDQKLILLVM